jgi:hypothetical protein
VCVSVTVTCVCVCLFVCNCDLRECVCVSETVTSVSECVCVCERERERVRARDLVVRVALLHLIICKAMARFFIKPCTNIIPGSPPLKFITACQNINMLTTRTF